MAWKKKEKTSDERRARGIREKEKERENSKLNIKLHFAIGSSRRKREDPTRRNSAVVTKRASSEESYFSGIKLFAVRKIAPNITYYSRQNIAAQRAALSGKDFGDNFRNAAKRKAANYFEINKTNVEIRTVKIIAEQFSRGIRYRRNSALHGKESKIKNRRRKIA